METPIAADIIEKAYDYLCSFAATRHGHGLFTDEEIGPLKRLFQERAYVDATLPRVMFLGEFKSGKSTLVNALLGGHYAASDLFEMTSWVARYWPSSSVFCCLHNQDATTVEMLPEDFLDRCERRIFSTEDLARIDRVDVGVVDSSIRVAFIDTPGLGSMTRANERRLIDAIEEADTILWVVAVDAIGSQREAVLIRDVLAKGTPYAVVLTKCDEFTTDDERKEVVQYLEKAYGVDVRLVFPVKALVALEQLTSGTQMTDDTGMEPLVDHLVSVSVRAIDVRRQAEFAHRRRIADLASTLLDRVERPLMEAIQAISDYDAIVVHLKHAVQAQSEQHVEAIVRARLLGQAQTALTADLEAALRDHGGSLSGDMITSTFVRHLGNDHLRLFWLDVQTELQEHLPRWWARHLSEAQTEVQAALNHLADTSWVRLAGILTPKGVGTTVNAIAPAVFEASIGTSLGIAGVATAYAAWLGPLAAQITLGAAATGVGLPIALMGAGVSAALYFWQKNRVSDATTSRAQSLLDMYIKQFLDEVVRPHVHPKLAEINSDVARSLVSEFRNRIEASLPGHPEELLEELIQIRKTLEDKTSEVSKV